MGRHRIPRRVADASVKQAATLAQRLRLCPSARLDRTVAGTHARRDESAPRPWFLIPLIARQMQMRCSATATAQFNERSSPIATMPQSSVATANAIRRRLGRFDFKLGRISTTYAHLSPPSIRQLLPIEHCNDLINAHLNVTGTTFVPLLNTRHAVRRSNSSIFWVRSGCIARSPAWKTAPR